MLRRAFLDPADSGRIQLLRSMVASFVSFALDFLLCALLVELAGLSYLPAASLSFAAGTSLNYLLTIAWIFRTGRLKDRRLEFLAYFGFAALGLFLNGAFMYLLTDVAGLHYLVSRVLSGALVFAFNFSLRKFVLFAAARPAPGAEAEPSPGIDAV
jgi:putative flippase GtrA